MSSPVENNILYNNERGETVMASGLFEYNHDDKIMYTSMSRLDEVAKQLQKDYFQIKTTLIVVSDATGNQVKFKYDSPGPKDVGPEYYGFHPVEVDVILLDGWELRIYHP